MWPTRRQWLSGGPATSGEGTFDSPIQSVPHAEAPGWTMSGTWSALYCLYLSASSLILVAEQHGTCRYGGERVTPRTVCGVVACAVLAVVAASVPEPVGLLARGRQGLVGCPARRYVQAKAAL